MKYMLASALLLTSHIALAQEGEVAPKPAAVIADGIPDVPQELADRTRPYFEVRTASFSEWEVTLKAHVAANPNAFSEAIRQDPLQHIRKQIMHALSDVIASVRDSAFKGHRSYTR